MPMRRRNSPEMAVPMTPQCLVRPGAVVDQRRGEAGACGDEQRQHHDHGGVADGEPEADRDGTLAVRHQLARGVVDGGDVVGVEGVPHA